MRRFARVSGAFRLDLATAGALPGLRQRSHECGSGPSAYRHVVCVALVAMHDHDRLQDPTSEGLPVWQVGQHGFEVE